jgi:DNA-binding beta-propeller fold protein YncE
MNKKKMDTVQNSVKTVERGASDGSIDTVSVVDSDANSPRIIDRVVVGDGPEGLAISPKGAPV